jgi:small subunit ribosomal protein S6
LSTFEPSRDWLEGLGAEIADGLDQIKGRHFMPLYEHVYLARQDLSAQQVEELTNQLSGVIAQLGGKVTKSEYWGLKSLAYRMRKNRKAHMTLLNVEAPSAALNEIERQERLNEDVLRYLTIRVDGLEEGPSAMMRKAERDERERGDRGDRGDRRERRPRREDGEEEAAVVSEAAVEK